MEVFYRVVKAGSFTNAEKVLNKSQGTLSRSVAILEERLDARLLHRKIKGLELTRKGEEVFRIAQRMFVDMDGLKKNLTEESGVSGKIRICATHAVAAYMLTDILIEFNEQYPDILFEVIADDSLIDLVQREVDIGIRPYDPENSDLIQQHLFTIERGLYASESYLEKYGEPTSLKDLDHHKFIVRSRPEENPYSDVGWALRIGREDKDPRRPVFMGNSSESLMKAASKGIGITASHKEMDAVKTYKLKRILSNVATQEYRDYLVYPKQLKRIQRIQTLEEFLMKKFVHLRT